MEHVVRGVLVGLLMGAVVGGVPCGLIGMLSTPSSGHGEPIWTVGPLGFAVAGFYGAIPGGVLGGIRPRPRLGGSRSAVRGRCAHGAGEADPGGRVLTRQKPRRPAVVPHSIVSVSRCSRARADAVRPSRAAMASRMPMWACWSASLPNSPRTRSRSIIA